MDIGFSEDTGSRRWRLTVSDRLILRAVGWWAYLFYPTQVRRFKVRMGYFPNIAVPRTINEKLFWRKVFDRSPLIGRLSDKLQAKTRFLERCPDIMHAGLVWVGDSISAMPVEALDGDVVIKTNCGSGQNHFSFDGEALPANIARTFRRWLRRYRHYGQSSLEWGYSRVKRKVFVERLIRDDAGNAPVNINVHTMNGRIAFAHVWAKHSEGAGHRDPDMTAVYDRTGNRLDALPVLRGVVNATFPDDFRPPASLARAYDCARRVGKGLDYARIDVLCTPDEVYAGEITFYPQAGFLQWTDPAVSETISRMWDLRDSWFLSSPHTGWRGLYARTLRKLLDEEAVTTAAGAHK